MTVILRELPDEKTEHNYILHKREKLIPYILVCLSLLLIKDQSLKIGLGVIWGVAFIRYWIQSRRNCDRDKAQFLREELLTVEERDDFILVMKFDSVLWSARKSEISHVDLNLKKAKSKWLGSKTDLTIFTNNGDSYLLNGHRFDESQLLEFSALFEAKTS